LREARKTSVAGQLSPHRLWHEQRKTGENTMSLFDMPRAAPAANKSVSKAQS
jgi:hypothetical protein